MKLLSRSRYAVENAAFNDIIEHAGAVIVADDERAAIVRSGRWHKCVFADVRDFGAYADKYDLYGDVCIMGADEAYPAALGFDCTPCVTYAYLKPLPPPVNAPTGVEIKRLAPSLAQTVLDAYHNPGGGYTAERMAEIMRTHGVFGAISDGALAGFIGRHGDGSMGMLEVFDSFKRRGIGGALERFMINYVMTFGRTPVCDVYADNPASLELQEKLGLTAAHYYTYWCEIKK